MAKPKRIATDEERARVRRLVGFGIPQNAICRMLGVTKRVFLREFREECAEGTHAVVERVANKLYSQALRGNVACMIFLLKCRGGAAWKERLSMEHSGPDGEPIQVQQRAVLILPPLADE